MLCLLRMACHVLQHRSKKKEELRMYTTEDRVDDIDLGHILQRAAEEGAKVVRIRIAGKFDHTFMQLPTQHYEVPVPCGETGFSYKIASDFSLCTFLHRSGTEWMHVFTLPDFPNTAWERAIAFLRAAEAAKVKMHTVVVDTYP
jgi:hypothetical protein